MNEPEVSKRLIHSYENVKKELGNIPALTKEDKGLDVKWEAFMKAQLETMAEHGREWMRVRYAETKASYKVAMAALETQKGLLEKSEGMVKKSDLQGYHDKLATLKTTRVKLVKDLKGVYDERKTLQTTYYRAIKAKIQKDIDAAKSALDANDLSRDMLKQDLTENSKDTNLAQYIIDTQLIPYCEEMIAVLKADLVILNGFEAKTAGLKLPTLS